MHIWLKRSWHPSPRLLRSLKANIIVRSINLLDAVGWIVECIGQNRKAALPRCVNIVSVFCYIHTSRQPLLKKTRADLDRLCHSHNLGATLSWCSLRRIRARIVLHSLSITVVAVGRVLLPDRPAPSLRAGHLWYPHCTGGGRRVAQNMIQ